MIANNIIRVSEYEKLYYDEAKPFRQKHWEALCHYQEMQKKQEETGSDYFRILNKGIQFTHYVGVLQAGNLTIEIVPKTDNQARLAENEATGVMEHESKQQWHGALLQMLQECRLLKINNADFANLNLRQQSILTMYLELFVTAAESLVHQGLVKNYGQHQGNQPALKGRLLFQKQVAVNSTHAERFYVRHTAYHYLHVYNSIVCQTLQLIIHISSDPNVTDRAGRLLAQFPRTDIITVTPDTFSRITYDRKTERYRDAIELARLLLLNYRPGITGGREKVIAILFDMNKLWEEWVYRRLKKEEARFDITVQRQQSADFYKAGHSHGHTTIRPDIVIRHRNEIIIVDTKWKLLKNRTPDEADLKQMFVYNLYWACNKSVLLYPASQLTTTTGSYQHFSKIKEVHSMCSVLTATIFHNQKLDPGFAEKLLQEIL